MNKYIQAVNKWESAKRLADDLGLTVTAISNSDCFTIENDNFVNHCDTPGEVWQFLSGVVQHDRIKEGK